MATHAQRLRDAYWHLAQATDFLHRFFMTPTPERLNALNEFLKQYQQAVQDGYVTAPRIFGV